VVASNKVAGASMGNGGAGGCGLEQAAQHGAV
jgi:hypothetical protein